LERALRRDHAAMREMFFGPTPAFDAVPRTLRELERVIAAEGTLG